MIDVSLVQVDPFHFLYQERSCRMDMDEISRAMGDVFQSVGRFMRDAGIAVVGKPLSVYPVPSPDRMIFQAGFIVSTEDVKKADGTVHGGTIPGCRVLHYIHHGPYAALRESYGELMDYAAENGLALSSPAWEVYLNDPGAVVSEDEIETAVYVSIGRTLPRRSASRPPDRVRAA